MFRGIKTKLMIRVLGYDLSTCSDLKFLIRQNGATLTFSGTVNSQDNEVMDVLIPKADAVKLAHSKAEIQVGITDSNNMPHLCKAKRVLIDDCLEVTGYGS